MRFKNLIITVLVAVYFTSCQKQVDWSVDPIIDTTTTTPPPGGTAGGLLVKIAYVQGTETGTTTFTYDAEKRLATETAIGTSGGVVQDSYRRYYRDAAGRIYKVAQLVKQPGIPTDTAFMYVYYDNPTTKNIKYSITEQSAFGFTSKDSTVYTYDGNGNIAVQMGYLSNDILGGGPSLNIKIEYGYATGNLATMKTYSDYTNSGTLAFEGTIKFTYDNKANPMVLNSEAFITGRIEGASRNNVVKMEMIDETDPADIATVTTVLTYDASNKPIKAKATLMPGGDVVDYTFFYQ